MLGGNLGRRVAGAAAGGPALFVRAVSTLLLLAVGAGCAGREWRREESLLRKRRVIVEIERWVGSPDSSAEARPSLDHPAQLSPGVVRAAFAHLRYRRHRPLVRDQEGPVIPAELALPIASSIADGLARCDASSRVRFRCEHRAPGVLLLPGAAVTRGVAFVRSGELHLFFDLVSATVEDDDPDDLLGFGNPTAGPPISRVQLELTPPARRVGGTRALGVAVNLEGLVVEERAAERRGPAGAPPSEHATLPGAEGEQGDGGHLTAEQVLERLRFLEELHRDGAISDEEYERRRELLLGRR